jgi:hypothetical protein
MHKTGTTSIQNSLQSLDDENFYYARLRGKPNHSASIASIFSRGPDSHIARKLRAKGRDDLDQRSSLSAADLDASIAAAGNRTLVISGEGIISMFEDELTALRNHLRSAGYDDIEIFAYVRPPVGFMSSAMQQKIKAGSASTINPRTSYPRYREKFERLDAVFGSGKVKLFKFDPASFPSNDVVHDFCSRAGIPLASVTPIRKNESITRLAAQLRLQYNAHAEEAGLPRLTSSLGRHLCDRLKSLDSTRFSLAPEVIAPHLAAIKDDVAWMEERLGQPLAEAAVEDSETAIRSTEDVMRPVPGINERLRAVLTEDGEAIPDSVADNTWKLLYLIAVTAARLKGDNSGLGDEATEKALRRAMRRKRRLLEAGEAGGETGEGAEGEGGPGQGRKGRQGGPRQGRERGQRREPGQGRRAAALQRDRGLNTRPVPQPGNPLPPAYWNAMPEAEIAASMLRRATVKPELMSSPFPLVSKDKNLIVLWSPKSACTTAYVWFSHISGFTQDVRDYAGWPHRHRVEHYQKSAMFADSMQSGMEGAKALRIIREPYSRAVSIYRHSIQTFFADDELARYANGKYSAAEGFSFETFLDMVSKLDMNSVDIHFRPQFHPYEAEHQVHKVINISKQNFFTELNAFEAEMGWPVTNFDELNWLHHLEGKRKASQKPLEGDSFYTQPFSRQEAKSGYFPSYAQLLTPEAKAMIEEVYKRDFEAYASYL